LEAFGVESDDVGSKKKFNMFPTPANSSALSFTCQDRTLGLLGQCSQVSHGDVPVVVNSFEAVGFDVT
jgi:hypothetical protein